mmetsp:Transcript_5161/g.16237  ORF Transcript_5161/g.16237 Transcript_5161/m.16237 type:complete len:303 (+) Transcript_5161:46-954(+)
MISVMQMSYGAERAEVSNEERQRRSRERNREHARRTRLRKKAQLASLQVRVTELQAETRQLEQALLDCTTAKILLGLATETTKTVSPPASPSPPTLKKLREFEKLLSAEENDDDDDDKGGGFCSSSSAHAAGAASASTTTRARDVSVSSGSNHDESDSEGEEANLGGTSSGLRTTIHWKNGYVVDERGLRRDLTPDELDSIRRERNRLHAKLTRDRKKVYVETLSRAISDLEDQNFRLRQTLTTHLDAKQQQDILNKTLRVPNDHNDDDDDDHASLPPHKKSRLHLQQVQHEQPLLATAVQV